MKLSNLVSAKSLISAGSLGSDSFAQKVKRIPDRNHSVYANASAVMADPEITSIYYRAQEVQPGGLFVAIKGQTTDGHAFIQEAIKRGAAAIVAQKPTDNAYVERLSAEVQERNPVTIHVQNTRIALAEIAARFYDNPSERMTLIGITGTNGKTTVAYLVESILMQAGYNVGVIGTINYRYSGKTYSNPMTTPESLDLQRILAEMEQHETTHVVMEASSHALDLYRIKCCWFDIAVFTNLSQDHLDFHGNMESYWSSKKRFFTEYLNQGPKKDTAIAVINCDDSRGIELSQNLTCVLLKTGSDPDCDIKAETSRTDIKGTVGKVSTPEGSFDFETPLVGAHNIENILSASAVGAAFHLPVNTIKAGIETTTVIPGRLERIDSESGRFVYVDYAHTPDALKNALSALREIAPARVICIFGCGGDRDTAKRPVMGEIVARLSDLSVVTSDNPRTEDPLEIIRQILAGIAQANGVKYSPQEVEAGFDKRGYVVEPDRRRAIELGIAASRPNDVVLIAGKGHETYQIIGNQSIAFDDREQARKELTKLVLR